MQKGDDDMTPRQLCEACRFAVREMAAIEQQILRIGTIGGPKGYGSTAMTGMPRGTNRPDAAQNQRVDAYEKILLDKKQEAVELLMQFEQMLTGVKDGTDRAILRYYYGAGWTDERIAEQMELTDRTVRGRRKKVVGGEGGHMS